MDCITHTTHNWVKQLSFAVECKFFISKNCLVTLVDVWVDFWDIFVLVVSTVSVLFGQIYPISGLHTLSKKI